MVWVHTRGFLAVDTTKFSSYMVLCQSSKYMHTVILSQVQVKDIWIPIPSPYISYKFIYTQCIRIFNLTVCT